MISLLTSTRLQSFIYWNEILAGKWIFVNELLPTDVLSYLNVQFYETKEKRNIREIDVNIYFVILS